MRGQDLYVLAGKFALRPMDLQWLIGKTDIAALYRDRRNQNKPVPSVVAALIMRFLLEHPDQMPLPALFRVDDFYRLCVSIDPDFTPRELGVLLGRDGAAGYRWLRDPDGKVMRLENYRWMMLIHRYLVERPGARERFKRLREIQSIINIEADARGFDTEILEDDAQWRPKSGDGGS